MTELVMMKNTRALKSYHGLRLLNATWTGYKAACLNSQNNDSLWIISKNGSQRGNSQHLISGGVRGQ